MRRSDRMKPVILVAESREQRAAREFGESQKALQERERQLAELIAYRDEYAGHMHQSGRAGVTAKRLQELHQFLSRLNDAIVQQERLVQVAARNCEHKRRDWSNARGKTLTLEKVVARYREEERRAADRREQKESDEFGQRKGLGRGLLKNDDQ